jgi:hypothetical protein
MQRTAGWRALVVLAERIDQRISMAELLPCSTKPTPWSSALRGSDQASPVAPLLSKRCSASTRAPPVRRTPPQPLTRSTAHSRLRQTASTALPKRAGQGFDQGQPDRLGKGLGSRLLDRPRRADRHDLRLGGQQAGPPPWRWRSAKDGGGQSASTNTFWTSMKGRLPRKRKSRWIVGGLHGSSPDAKSSGSASPGAAQAGRRGGIGVSIWSSGQRGRTSKA